jgi:hypothetical protein
MVALLLCIPNFMKLKSDLSPLYIQRGRCEDRLINLWKDYQKLLIEDGGFIVDDHYNPNVTPPHLSPRRYARLLTSSLSHIKPFDITSDQIRFNEENEEHGLAAIKLHEKKRFYVSILYRMNDHEDDRTFEASEHRNQFPCRCGILPCIFPRSTGSILSTITNSHCKTFLTNKCEDFIFEKGNVNGKINQIQSAQEAFLQSAGILTFVFLIPFLVKVPKMHESYLNEVVNLPGSREQLIIRGCSVGVATLMIRQVLVFCLLRQTSWF